MTAPPDDTSTDLNALIATLREERDALAEALERRNSEYGERIEQQAATIDVLRAMSSSPGDAEPVFNLMVERARAFCGADNATAAVLDGDMLRLMAQSGMNGEAGRIYAAQFPRPVSTDSMFGRSILKREAVQVPDVWADPNHYAHGGVLSESRAVISVPLLRGGIPIGAMTLGRRVPGKFSVIQVELLQTFAEQAVIAITSAETYRALQTRTSDLQESLEYQTATSDVLKVISRSTFDLQPVLETVLLKAARLCDAEFGVISTREDDAFRVGSVYSNSPEYHAIVGGRLVPAERGTVIGRTAVEGRIVHILDIGADPDYAIPQILETGGARTCLGVPLLREGAVVGVISLARPRVEAFTEQQIELVSTFADQAVIAIENTRLLTEQREALEQQTATADVLQVINASPGDLKPVFDAMLEKALTLCGSAFGTLDVFDGEMFHVVASRGLPAALASYFQEPITPAPGMTLHRVVLGEDIVHVADLMDDDAYRSRLPTRVALVDLGGARTQLIVSLRKDNRLIGVIMVYRREVRPYSDKQISLLTTFADQAVIAMENARLITEQREALEQQTATAEVLQVINASPGNLAPVFEAMLEKAIRLCEAEFGTLRTWDGERFHHGAAHGDPQLIEWSRRQRPFTPDGDGPLGRIVRGEEVIRITDDQLAAYQTSQGAETSGEPPHWDRPRFGALVAAIGLRSGITLALRKDATLLGTITVYRKNDRPFTDKQIALLQNFAAQAVIAMENARLINEQREALEQQTATAEVLGVINASPGDLAPVFDTILEKAHSLCGAPLGSLVLRDGDQLRAVATRGYPQEYETLARQGFPPTRAFRLFLSGERFVHVLDSSAPPTAFEGDPLRRALAEIAGVRTALFVPLRKDETVLGYISAQRQEIRPFTDKQIALLQNFAAQAVIAVENARLLTETRELLEQQTATAEVLQVINSSPGNLTPVFEAMLEKAMRLCGVTFGSLYTYDGVNFHSEAQRGVPEAYAAFREKNPPKPEPGSPIARVIKSRRPLHILDVMADEAYAAGQINTRAQVDLGGTRTVLIVPLLKDETFLGHISIYRQEVRAFSDKQIALLENFAAQAVIAMENARLLDEIQQRQEELRITFENMGDGVALFDETRHLVASNRRFQDMLDVPDDVISARPAFADYIRYLADRGEYGPDPEDHVQRLLAFGGQPTVFERTRPNGRVIEVRGNPVLGGGFVVIYSDITERKRNEEALRAARDAAEEASRTIEAAYRELKTAQANLIQAEKMASLGQLTAGIAHEIKNPLNFVNNFAALSADLLSELKETAAPGFAALTDDQRADIDDVSAMLTSNLEKITEHGKRADGIVKAMLEHSRGSSAERRMVDLNALIDEALNLAYHGARAQDQIFNITLERDFGEGIAPIEVNPQDMTRVFLNLFSNGFYAATRRARNGGDAGFVPTLKVTTRDADGAVEIRVRDNGTGIPADIRDKLFQPFFTTKPTGEGTGLGLSITYDIVTQQHGGSITVDSNVGEYSEFTILLPRSP